MVLKKKIIKRKKKTMYGNTVAIHNVFFLNYMDKFSTSSIFKKIGKDNFEKKIIKKLKKQKRKKKKSILGKKRRKKHVKQ